MSTRPAFLGMGLLASVLAALIALALDAPQPAEDTSGIVPIRHAPKLQPRVASEDPEDHTDQWAQTILARPLFSRDRKPTPVAAAAAGGPAISTLPRLTGVIVGPFGRSAIFAPSDGGKPLIAIEGSVLGPYTVQSIAPGHVTIAGPDGVHPVDLSYDATTRKALAAELPQPPPAQGPGAPNNPPLGAVPVGQAPGMPLGPGGRPGGLNLRAGVQFQRALSAIQNVKPSPEGIDSQ